MRAKIAFLLILFAWMPAEARDGTPSARSLETPRTAGKKAPPFTVRGFTYSVLPQQIHMNICNQPSCGAGSKVSYVIYPPKPGKTFADYRAERAQIEKAFKALKSSGVTMTFAPPTERKNKLFKIFESRRIVTAPDGRKEITISRTLLASTIGIDFISTARDEKNVETNLALFMVGAIASTGIAARDKP